MKFFVAVAGNIGVGKSTLTELLCYRLGWKPFYEAVADNPYLSDFYADMHRWSFHSQVFFLARRLHHYHRLMEHPTSVVQDRTIYEDAEVFAENLYRQGYLSPRDYRTYRDIYEAVVRFLPPPDLVIYLKASEATLRRRIALRGRHFEREISDEYLAQLNRLYDEWIQGFRLCPVLTIPSDDLDFVRYTAHMDLIVERVLDRLHGKEEMILP
ncbi:MAG: deoxynucleoside kinase [Anaerolineae bacterium]|nr:deoxynucleoside kinase [Anaerolineae bacterium]